MFHNKNLHPALQLLKRGNSGNRNLFTFFSGVVLVAHVPIQSASNRPSGLSFSLLLRSLPEAFGKLLIKCVDHFVVGIRFDSSNYLTDITDAFSSIAQWLPCLNLPFDTFKFSNILSSTCR